MKVRKVVEELVDFSGLESHIKESGRPFRESVLDYFRMLGERQGYVVRENSSVIEHGLTLGKIDLAWVDVNTIFFCEFASLENNPERVVFVLSSKAKASSKAVEKLINESGIATPLRGRTVLVDVSEKEVKSL